MPSEFTGVFPILPTPFGENEALDLDSWERMIRFMMALGVDGITILGVLGEANRLLESERDELVAKAAAVTGGAIPVIVGVAHQGTLAVKKLSLRAAELGAAGVMIAPPIEPAPNAERCFEFYEQVARDLPIPIVVQDHPASSQVQMPVALLLRLVQEIPRVACIKLEAPPTPGKFAAVRQGMTQRQVPLLTGLGALYGLFDLESGSGGFMTGFAFPEILLAMTRAAAVGDMRRAQQLYDSYLPLVVFEQQPGIAIRKEIFRRRGLITHNTARHPGGNLTTHSSQQLDALLARALPGVDIALPLKV